MRMALQRRSDAACRGALLPVKDCGPCPACSNVRCFFHVGVLFVAVHQQSVVPVPSGHMFWLGLLVGLAAVILPGGFRVLMAIVAVFALGWVHLVGHHVSFSSRLVPWVLVALLGGVVGLVWGRRRGLRQLGESDFRIRFGNVRGIRRWF